MRKKDLPEILNREEMIGKINQLLTRADYSIVYLVYIFLDEIENNEKE